MELLQKKSLLSFKYFSITILLFTQTLIAQQKIFSCTDRNGNTVFTDTPENNPDCINPKEKTLNVPTVVPYISDSNSNRLLQNSPNNTNDSINYSISIIEPASGATINRCGGVLDVSYNITPRLVYGYSAEVYLDGAKFSDTASTSFTIPGLNPGQHNLTINILNDGKITATDSVIFNFLRNCRRTGSVNPQPNPTPSGGQVLLPAVSSGTGDVVTGTG